MHCSDHGWERKDACSACVVSSLIIWESKVFWGGGSFWCLDFKMLSHGQWVWNRGSVRHISQQHCFSIQELSSGCSECLPWGHGLPLRLLVKKIAVTYLF